MSSPHFFFLNDPATTEIYTLSLHDALPISHDGSIGDWPADETLEMRTPEKPVGVGGISKVELWIVPAEVRGASRGDRKSTRLNSSHQIISYAVFCLKKKKKKKKNITLEYNR